MHEEDGGGQAWSGLVRWLSVGKSRQEPRSTYTNKRLLKSHNRASVHASFGAHQFRTYTPRLALLSAA